MNSETRSHKGNEVLLGPPGFLFGLSLLSMIVSGLVMIVSGLLL